MLRFSDNRTASALTLEMMQYFSGFFKRKAIDLFFYEFWAEHQKHNWISIFFYFVIPNSVLKHKKKYFTPLWIKKKK